MAGRRLLLVDGDLFEQRPGREPQRVGDLFDHLQLLASWAGAPSGQSTGVLAEAQRYAERAAELRFVLQELMPLLRSLAADLEDTPPGPEEIASDLDRFEDRATSLLNVARERTSASTMMRPSPEERAVLARQLGLPCALVGTAVTPLQPVPAANEWDLHVRIESQLFRYCIERPQPLQDFLQALDRVEEWKCRRALVHDPGLRQSVSECVVGAHTLLSACGLAGQALRIPFRGAAHFELLHRRGSWVLAYGPERPRAGEGQPIFVGVAIQGRTRAERLSVAPTISRTAAELFVQGGQPRRGGLCMGQSEQYLHLLSPRFTDAEALLFWLDAALVLATGRSVFHQQWRVRSGRAPGHRFDATLTEGRA